MNHMALDASLIPAVEIDDNVCVHSPAGGLHLLNPVAAEICLLSWQGKSQNEITQNIAQKYEADVSQVSQDVDYILNTLTQLGMQPDNNKVIREDVATWGESMRSEYTLQADDIFQHYKLGQRYIRIVFKTASLKQPIDRLVGHLQMDFDKADLTLIVSELGEVYSISHDEDEQVFDTLDELLENLQWRMIECAYRGGNWMTVLHSSAMAAKNNSDTNHAVVFSAEKGSGKSTLTYLLQKSGYKFLADDIVPVDGEGNLQPMPMCQRVKSGSWPLLDQQSHKLASDIYARHDGQDIKYLPPITGELADWQAAWKIKAIVYPKYDDSHEQLSVIPLTALQSLQMLCQTGSVFGGDINQQQLEKLVDWVKATPAYFLRYKTFNQEVTDNIDSWLK